MLASTRSPRRSTCPRRGCSQPSRSASGLERAALLGLRQLAQDEELREAIRRERERAAGEASGPPSRRPAAARLTELADRRRKLLDLYYAGAVEAELFARRRSSERSREWSIECRAERSGPGSHGCRGGSSPHQGA
jgi:hypothetical protein